MALKSYGQVVVASPSTPVQLTSNQSDPTVRAALQSVTIQALPTNVGIVTIGFSDVGRGTGIDALYRLPKPANATTGPFDSVTYTQQSIPAGFNLNDLYIDADNANDGVLVSGIQG